MASTSINIQPVKAGSELHNTRAKNLDYVRPELSHLNESWQCDSIQNRLATIKENYQKTTGQQMQKKATPIREGVIVIHKDTTMQQLQDFARKAEERFGIKAIQIHTHKDEGHKDAKEWKPNLHAHIVFDWTQENGKSCKLNRQDMAELQTLLSLSLKMDRGQSSDAKHLNAVQFKNKRENEKKQALSSDIKKLETSKRVKGAISKTAERFSDLLGKTTNDKEKEALQKEKTALNREKTALESERNQLSKELSDVKMALNQEKNKSSWNIQRATTAERDLRANNERIGAINGELSEFGKAFNQEQIKYIKEHFPNIAKEMERGQEQTKSRGMSR